MRDTGRSDGPTTGAPAVSVIVPARDAAATIDASLAGVCDQDLDAPYEVIVVDDGSADATAELVRAASRPVTLIRTQPAGAAAARNVGARKARASVLAFTDADCRPTRGWLSAGMRAIAAADIVQGRVEPEPAVFCGPFDRTVWIYEESGLYETANLFVRKATFERVGGFEAWLEQAGGRSFADDTWFGWRARRGGATAVFERRAVVHHAVLRRGPLEYIRDKRRLAWFPAAVHKMPELRPLLFAGCFLTSRTAAFDAALVGVTLAAGARSRWPLIATLPYLAVATKTTASWQRRAPAVAVVGPIAEVVGFAALVYGSVRHRTVVI